VTQGVQEAFDTVREADRLSAPTSVNSEVSRIRSSELEPAQADPLVGQVITLCQQAGELTEGAFTDHLPTGGLRRPGLSFRWGQVGWATMSTVRDSDRVQCCSAGRSAKVGEVLDLS
jgi:hypothetical protein